MIKVIGATDLSKILLVMDRNTSNYPPLPPLTSNRKILLHEDHKKGFKGELIEDGYARPRCPENRGSSIHTAATPRFLNF